MTTPIATPVKTRKNAVPLPTWDPIFLWYAKAVAEMKKRQVNDPTSWIYQAAIHGFTLDPRSSESVTWTQWTQGQTLPTDTQQGKFWDQCQHGTWYFLPWHRMYLGYFESIVRQTVESLGGPVDWTLPFWDYNDGTAGWKLPAAFTEKTLPDGTPNALREPLRDRGNNGKPVLDAHVVSTQRAFNDHVFTSSVAGPLTGFGGPATNFLHLGRSHGALESNPHDQVHGELGGLMGDPYTAAYDPIFWLHHANIDRLWQVWLNADAKNTNPDTKSKWQTFKFSFNDGLGKVVTHKPAEVVDSTTSPFHYQYENTPSPGPKPAAPKTTLLMAADEPIPEMVGATPKPIPLTETTKTVAIRLFPMTSPLMALGAPDSHFQQAHLQLENVRGKGRPGRYEIYLNLPDDAAKKLPEQCFVATLPTFGLERASIATDRHAGSGLKLTFNVTDIVNYLKSENKWDPKQVNVSFIPRRQNPPGATLEVGRISLHYS